MLSLVNKILLTIILASFIIGGFIYLGILQKPAVQEIKISNGIVADSLKNESFCQAKENSVVTRVIDGDTVIVEGGFHIRLLGIDADEKGYPCFESAKKRLEELVLNKPVILEKDRTDMDQYERCLRTIFVGDKNIDAQLVGEGLAVARFYQPDVKYKTEITDAERQAIENKVGCKWSK